MRLSRLGMPRPRLTGRSRPATGWLGPSSNRQKRGSPTRIDWLVLLLVLYSATEHFRSVKSRVSRVGVNRRVIQPQPLRDLGTRGRGPSTLRHLKHGHFVSRRPEDVETVDDGELQTPVRGCDRAVEALFEVVASIKRAGSKLSSWSRTSTEDTGFGAQMTRWNAALGVRVSCRAAYVEPAPKRRAGG